ncbi:MAG: hypothetical protein HC848_03845 [Limnobacter sp.]|nr:hypothetical protein [Limnobacter sp.]
MAVSFALKNGVATSNDLKVMAPLFRIGGSGQIDLVQNNLDYTANATVVATSTGQNGKTLGDGLKGLTVPVRLYGNFGALQYEVLLKELAKAAVGAKLDEVKNQAKARVDDKKRN